MMIIFSMRSYLQLYVPQIAGNGLWHFQEQLSGGFSTLQLALPSTSIYLQCSLRFPRILQVVDF